MLRGSDVIKSRWGAYLYANQLHGRKATPEEACAVYEEHGAATGERTDERIRFFERIEPKVAEPEARSDPNWFTDDDIEQMGRWLTGKVETLLAEANRKLRELRRGSLTVEDVAILAVFQRKAILSNGGYCGNKMIAGFVKARKKAHPGQKFYNAHHINEAFAVLEAIGFSRKVGESDYVWNDRSKSRCRRYELCCAPNLVSRRHRGTLQNSGRVDAA